MPLQNTIPVTDANVVARTETSFLPITDQDTIIEKIRKLRDSKADTSQFWATLGRQDNGAILGKWSGKVICSREGGNTFTTRGKKIMEEAENLRSIFPDLNPDLTTVYEKFISLDNVDFSADANARKLRLTITLKDREHAVTFLQHTDEDDTTSQNGVFEYILPEKVEDLGKKNRLTYFFDVPGKSIDGKSRFIIKVITFQSPVSPASSAGDVTGILRKFDTPYGLCVYKSSPDGDYFSPVDASDIDRTKKTLLLLHGTFSSVQGSYGDLLTNKWLASVIAEGEYHQIIGFDHYTVVESPLQNARKLIDLLTPGGPFVDTVDIITTSRGGLVGKNIANMNQSLMKIERVATVACANGVQFISTGQGIGKLLGIWKQTAVNPNVKLLLFLAQLSVNGFINQPGLAAMDKHGDSLHLLLSQAPVNKGMRYYPICGDYRLDGNHPLGWKFLDLLLTGIMADAHHDWVVETDEQVIMPEGFYAYSQQGKDKTFYRNQPIDTTHTRYFYDPMTQVAKKCIFDFLHDPGSVL